MQRSRRRIITTIPIADITHTRLAISLCLCRTASATLDMQVSKRSREQRVHKFCTALGSSKIGKIAVDERPHGRSGAVRQPKTSSWNGRASPALEHHARRSCVRRHSDHFQNGGQREALESRNLRRCALRIFTGERRPNPGPWSKWRARFAIAKLPRVRG